jgi:hypothetical protein
MALEPGHVPRELLERFADSDPAVARMLKRNLPLTRDTYLGLAWGADAPEVWGAEHEAEVPEPFRDTDTIGRPGAEVLG